MHANHVPRRATLLSGDRRPSRGAAGFSLVEVTLAIGIIAFAFVALFGLLPTGMTTFRAAVDSTNDTSMMQDLSSMVQVTAWKEVDGLAEDKGGDIYYFDEEGRRTDSKQHEGKPEVIGRRLYQAKLIIEPFLQPGGTDSLADARRIIVVIGDVLRPKSKTDFDSARTAAALEKSNPPLDLRTRAFIVTRLESASGT